MVKDRRSYGGLKATDRRVVIEAIDKEGGIKASSLGGEEIFQPEDLDRAQHYGFKSNAPKDSEGVLHSDAAGSIIIAERDRNQPSDFNDNEGETILYSKDGNYVYLKNDAIVVKHSGGSVIKIENDNDIHIEHSNGQYIDFTGNDIILKETTRTGLVYVGDTSGAKKITLDNDIVKASPTFDSWVQAVSSATSITPPSSLIGNVVATSENSRAS